MWLLYFLCVIRQYFPSSLRGLSGASLRWWKSATERQGSAGDRLEKYRALANVPSMEMKNPAANAIYKRMDAEGAPIRDMRGANVGMEVLPDAVGSIPASLDSLAGFAVSIKVG